MNDRKDPGDTGDLMCMNRTAKMAMRSSLLVWGVTLILIGGFSSSCHSSSRQNQGSGVDGPYAPVVVDCREDLGPLRNLAPGVNFWGFHGAQKIFMEEVGVGLYRLKINLALVKEAGGTYVNFPWEALGQAELNALVNNVKQSQFRGGRLLIQIFGVPRGLSAVPDDDPVLVCNVPNYAKYPPKDYTKWKDLVSGTVGRLLGLGIRADYYEIFGEANVGATWYQPDMPVTAE